MNGEKFNTYYELLVKWNRMFNLTAIIDKREVYIKHFEDSLTAEQFIDSNATLLDVGSGAGFPGVPIKIERDDLSVTLIDSLQKRVNFLQELIRELRLSKIEALHKRAEEMASGKRFDVVVARAVAPLVILSEYCLPLIKVGGRMIAYKAMKADEEIKDAKYAIKLMGGEIAAVEEKILTDGSSRKLIIIKKVKATPPGYPRTGNKPRSQPLVIY